METESCFIIETVILFICNMDSLKKSHRERERERESDLSAAVNDISESFLQDS